jgi:hypothetical protein
LAASRFRSSSTRVRFWVTYIERLEDRLERNLIVPSEFFGSTRIRTVDGLVDDRRPDPPPLEEKLALIRAGTRLQILILSRSLCRHGASYGNQGYDNHEHAFNIAETHAGAISSRRPRAW